MQIKTGPGEIITEPNDETIEKVIRGLLNEPTDPFAILETDDATNFIQTYVHNPSNCEVEYWDDLFQHQYKLDPVPIETVISLFRSYCHDETSWRNDFPWNDVTPKRNKSRPQANAGPIGSDLCDGSVYLLKAGPYYKIGKSINFDQRLNQIKLQLPYPIEVIHRILTDDVTGIESYWHRRFAMKRTNGEWFLLTDEDVAIFTSRTQM